MPGSRLLRLLVIVTAGGLGLGVCLVALGPGVQTLAASSEFHGPVAPRLRPLEGPTILYDADGNVLDRLGTIDRTPVTLDEVPKRLADAVIATEDKTFWTNSGVDVRGTVRALVENVEQGDATQGGSTITQQLIKNRYFRNPARDLDRKVKEAVLATRLTDEWTKRRILQEYLNTVYFGHNAYGVNAAARRIIGASLQTLTVADVALLAGIIKDPSRFDPFVRPEAARARRAYVLRQMRTEHMITAAEAADANDDPVPSAPACNVVPPDPRCLDELGEHNQYATEVKNRLLEIEALGSTEQEAAQKVFTGGLRVYTAYKPDVAYLAQQAIDDVVGRFGPTYAAAMAVMDPRTGEVPALAGPVEQHGFNLATMGPTSTSGRFVGSTFKPIVLATAIANGYSPKDTVDGHAPCRIRYLPWYDESEGPYIGKNAGGEGGGYADLYTQTRHSVNCAFLRLGTSVGLPKVSDMATRLGMTRPIGTNLTISIGDSGHSPLEMATVYSTFAAQGVRHDPIFIRRVEDSTGRVLYRAPVGRRVLDPEIARTVTDVLSHVTDPDATAPRAKLDDGRPMAGKTGTLDDSKDAWFAGYTPQLVAAVWMGNPLERTPMTNVGGIRVYGGSYPAQIWQRFMSAMLKDQPVLTFVPPDQSRWPRAARVNPDGGRFGTAPTVRRAPATTTTTTGPEAEAAPVEPPAPEAPPPAPPPAPTVP